MTSFKLSSQLSPPHYSNCYFPSGSISSLLDSLMETEEDGIIIDNSDTKPDNETHISYEVIPYESVLINHKDTQTEKFEKSSKKSKKIENLNQIIENLKLECSDYAKQNQELRVEIAANNSEIETDKINSLKEEIKRYKSKLHVHENMVEKLMTMAEELCGDNSDANRKFSKVDFHSYNYLISKLEIVRSRMKRFCNKIQQLEADKASITGLLDFYVSAAKIIESQNYNKTMYGSITPDCINPAFSSRKSSVVMENSINTIRNTQFDEENYGKKHSRHEKKDLGPYPSTLKNLKGISKLVKPNLSKKNKNENSCSVSPLIPKPKKGTKVIVLKENNRSRTVRSGKPSIDDTKKKQKNRCKS